MAYSASGLTRIGGASNADLWFYTSADAIATVNTAGYFQYIKTPLAKILCTSLVEDCLSLQQQPGIKKNICWKHFW